MWLMLSMHGHPDPGKLPKLLEMLKQMLPLLTSAVQPPAGAG